jgi:hypothetical protein
MDEMIGNELPASEPTDLKAAVEDCIKRIDQAFAQMTRSQEEIDRLKAETWTILERLKAA